MTTDKDKVSMWTERVAAWRASGKTSSVFAAELGVHPVTLLNWARRIKKEPAAFGPTTRKASVQVVPVVRKASVPSHGEAPRGAAPVAIDFAGARLFVSADSDERGLTIALRALGAAR